MKESLSKTANKLAKAAYQSTIDRANRTIVNPINNQIDSNITDIATSIGGFIIKSVRGKFQRSITFTIGINYYDRWMEEALYGILYEYNDIKKVSELELSNKDSSDGSSMYYRLDDGVHNLKYRNYKIMVAINTKTNTSASGRSSNVRMYQIITYDLSPQFVVDFESDMIRYRNSLLKIKKDSPTISVYKDYHEGDGYTYWEKALSIPKRKLATVYMKKEDREKLVNTLNEFFSNKPLYVEHGISHNLKILLYGPPGPQPVSTIIPTPNGPKRLGDLNPGNMVYDDKRKPVEIEEIYDYESDFVYEIRLVDGTIIHAADTHKWPMMNDILDSKIMTTLEIANDISSASNQDQYRFNKLMKRHEDGKLYLSEIKSVTKTNNVEKMRCLHLNTDDHLYLTTNDVVTCNSGKDSIAKMIASEWNRNIYYITGGKNGKFIPNALTDTSTDVIDPLFLISDIDKYPSIINEMDIKVSKKGSTDGEIKEETVSQKQNFANMINALDGILSGDDKIVVMTTNHIEKFSKTFLRPGRVDLLMYIGYVDSQMFRKFVWDNYKTALPVDIKLNKDNYTISQMQFDVLFMKLTLQEFVDKYTGKNK